MKKIKKKKKLKTRCRCVKCKYVAMLAVGHWKSYVAMKLALARNGDICLCPKCGGWMVVKEGDADGE